MPKKERFEAYEEALSTRPKSLVCKATVLEIIHTVIDKNVFGFGHKTYIQKEGVAIGSRLGKNFACTYMQIWDEALFPIFLQEIYR